MRLLLDFADPINATHNISDKIDKKQIAGWLNCSL